MSNPKTQSADGSARCRLERRVRHQGESRNGPPTHETRKTGIISNLSSGICGLQSLLGLFGVMQCRQSHNQNSDKIARQFFGLQELYTLWQSLGRPKSGLWRDMKIVNHGCGGSCDMMSNVESSPATGKPSPTETKP
jgi:hypothetical protein